VRLTLHTDFALRVLIHVGLNDGKLTTINDIAQSFGISKAHLMKVVNDLSRKGYLDTVRGRNGGIRLMREPRDINIGQVVRDTENQLAVIGCLERHGYCPPMVPPHEQTQLTGGKVPGWRRRESVYPVQYCGSPIAGLSDISDR
jgi:Rrf2 family protein